MGLRGRNAATRLRVRVSELTLLLIWESDGGKCTIKLPVWVTAASQVRPVAMYLTFAVQSAEPRDINFTHPISDFTIVCSANCLLLGTLACHVDMGVFEEEGHSSENGTNVWLI